MADAIFNHKIKELKLEEHFQSDSCGTGNYHLGGLADHHTIFLLNKNGVKINRVVRLNFVSILIGQWQSHNIVILRALVVTNF